MQDERLRIIREAILSKLGNGFAMFTDDEVLAAAGITEEDLERVREMCDGLAVESGRPSPLLVDITRDFI